MTTIATGTRVPDDPSLRYYHPEMIGTTRFMTDFVGNPGDEVVYTAFGQRIDGSPRRFGYAGAWGYQSTLDDQTPPAEVFPFLHVGARYYDPATGRFLQRDPIGIMGGGNVYAYVGGNPISRVDPSGLLWGDAIENWVANNFWRRIHSDQTLANMSDARAVAEAVGISVGVGVAGAGAYVAGGALAAGGGTASISVGSSGAAGIHVAVGSSTAGWWHYAGAAGYMTASQLSSQFGTRILTLPARYPNAIRNMPDNAMNCATGALRGFFSAL